MYIHYIVGRWPTSTFQIINSTIFPLKPPRTQSATQIQWSLIHALNKFIQNLPYLMYPTKLPIQFSTPSIDHSFTYSTFLSLNYPLFLSLTQPPHHVSAHLITRSIYHLLILPLTQYPTYSPYHSPIPIGRRHSIGTLRNITNILTYQNHIIEFKRTEPGDRNENIES